MLKTNSHRKRCCILFLSAFVTALIGCQDEIYKVPVNPRVGDIGWGDPLPVNAAVLVRPKDRDYVHYTSDTAVGMQVTLDVPVGEALESATKKVYTQVFSNLAVARSLDEAKSHGFVIEPEFMDLKYRWKGPDNQVTQITIKMQFYDGKRKIWEKIYAGREHAIGAQSRANPDFKRWEALLGQTISEGLAETLTASVSDLKSDAELQRVLAALESKGTVVSLEGSGPKETPPSPPPVQKKDDVTAELALWESIKFSTRYQDFQRYLEKYPTGLFADLAKKQIRNLISLTADGGDTLGKDEFSGIDFGTYHALVIGINDYKSLPTLKTAVNDAKAIAETLEKDYGFRVTLLLDTDRTKIINTLDDYRKTLGTTDNLLIYYAGHGWLDDDSGRGYWLPRTAEPERRSNWLSNATITDTLKSLSAKHIMIVADSCYSGTLTRAATIKLRDKNYLRRMSGKQARVALVSGGLEPVADKGGGGNSPFANALIKALKANDGVMDGTVLFSQIRRPVMTAANQTPEYSDVRDAGHDGGDFIFVRRK